MLDYKLEYYKGILFVRLEGILDKKTSVSLNSYLIPYILKNGIRFLVYDLFGLTSIDEEGLKTLKWSRKAILTNKGKILLCNNSKFNLNNIKIKEVENPLIALKLLEV